MFGLHFFLLLLFHCVLQAGETTSFSGLPGSALCLLHSAGRLVTFPSFLKSLFDVYGCCLHVCMCSVYVPGVHRGRKRALVPGTGVPAVSGHN